LRIIRIVVMGIVFVIAHEGLRCTRNLRGIKTNQYYGVEN